MRTLASIAKAAVDAFSDQRDGFSLAGALANTRDRAGAVALAPPIKLLEQTSRSLIAEIEVKAHFHGAPVQTRTLHLDGTAVAHIHSFERQLLGFATGIHDGVIILSTLWEPELMPWLCHRLQDFAALDLATFRIAGPGLGHAAVNPLVIRNRTIAALMSARHVQEVMPLDARFTEFFDRLGLGVRGSAGRSAPATAPSMEFHFASGASAAEPNFQKLMARERRFRQSFRKVASIERFVAARPRPYRASLTHHDGRLASVASGFIEGDLALIAYQLNHRADNQSSPSLMLRSFLLRRLIDEGVRSLAFIGSCAGQLLRYCEPVPAAELLMTRNSRSARVKYRACVMAQPTGRVAQLSAELAKTVAPPALR